MSIFTKRVNYKPFEYPQLVNYIDIINKSYWVHSELSFEADKQDFLVNLTDVEQNAVINAMLAVSQIEVNVKSFWSKLYDYLPKPEIAGLGACFSDCEWRHSEAYSRLIDVLGVSDKFEKLMDIPQIKGRVDFLSEYLGTKVKHGDKRGYALALIIFALFIENVSLFSQFAIILSFYKFNGVMKNISNVIAWTSAEEAIHANAGIHLFNIIKEENPEIFDDDMKEIIIKAAKKSILVESEILDWIFEKGQIPNCSKEQLIAFMQDRINTSVKSIGINKIFSPDKKLVKSMKWFQEEINTEAHDDFFAVRPTEYSKVSEDINENSLF